MPETRWSNLYLVYVVVMLTLASTLSIIDRQILNVMIGPVKRDLGGISDTQVSLIMGFAFSLFYSFLALPAGWIADRYNRRNLMAAGIVGWSIMTALCGMASQYWQLFLARMGVGVGEATLGPAATSTLSDYFSPERLPLAVGIISAAPFIGQGLANIGGGPLIDYLESVPNLTVPLIGQVYSWQMVFILVGLPGVLLGALMLTLREPPRRGTLSVSSGGLPLSDLWRFIRQRGMFFGLIFLAYLGLATQGWSLFSWIIEFYVRNHGWTRTQIGINYGAIAMVVGIIGSVSGGLLAGRLLRSRVRDATLRVAMLASAVLLPTAVMLTLVDDPWLGLGLLVPVTFCMAMPNGLMLATLQSVAPNELRGQMVAVYLIAVNFLAYTFAPSLPAVLSDYVFASELALGKSISLLAAINYSMAFLALGFSLRYYRAALDQTAEWNR
ncbi:MAG: MFS transporter [Halieaceae bacterium]|nr:MFS transporter [Halieaceae bacterium]